MKRIFILLLVLGVLVVCACARETKKPTESKPAAEPTESTETSEPSKTGEESGPTESTMSKDASQSTDQPTFRLISQTEAAEIMKTETDYILLDVRTQAEFQEGHIPGAICIPNETIEDKEPSQLPDKSRLILVYCRSGRRSKEAALKLAAMGYTNIMEFGGIIDWTGEVVKG